MLDVLYGFPRTNALRWNGYEIIVKDFFYVGPLAPRPTECVVFEENYKGKAKLFHTPYNETLDN